MAPDMPPAAPKFTEPNGVIDSTQCARRLNESTIFEDSGRQVEAILELLWAIMGHLASIMGHLGALLHLGAVLVPS